MSKDRTEVDLHDVLKQRVEAGEPIHINGPSNAANEAAIADLTKETGKSVRVVQLLDVDTASLQSASPQFAEVVSANTNVRIALKS